MPYERLRPGYAFGEDRVEQLKSVVPEAFADGKINWDVLREALGEFIESETGEVEHFGMSWPGKREARRLASAPSEGNLVPCSGEGVDEERTRNTFIEGDNLEVLKLLRKSYAGRVKMIYIDPPYNTGNDFVYSDDFVQPLEQYLRLTRQMDEGGAVLTTNPRSSGRFHSKWLNMMYPRLLVARQLLAEEGAIFVSIDDNEVNNLRTVLNEIFGEENFIAQITIQSNPRGRQSERFTATVHEYLIVYARDADRCQLSGSPLTPEQLKEFKSVDTDGRRYRLLGLRQRGAASRRQDRPNMFYPIYVNPSTGQVSLDRDVDFSEEILPKKSTGADGRWMWARDKVRQELHRVEARLISRRKSWDIFVRDYLSFDSGEERTRKARTIWDDKELNYQNGTKELKQFLGEGIYEYPKPVTLMKRIVVMADKPGLTCMDFFSGSCTMAQAILEMNLEDAGSRRFMMVQLPEPTPEDSIAREAGYHTIAEIGKERIRRVISKISPGRDGEGLGFKVFRLDRSSFRAWRDYQGDDVGQIEMLYENAQTPLAEGWTREALLTEVMLIQGFPLDSTVTHQPEFRSNMVLEVTATNISHRLLVCLDERIHDEAIEGLKLHGEDTFVCLDSALTDQAKVSLSDKCNLATI